MAWAGNCWRSGPRCMRRQQSENEHLRSQFAPDLVLGWGSRCRIAAEPHVRPGDGGVAGERCAAFTRGALRRDDRLELGRIRGAVRSPRLAGRDEMYRRMQESTLFVSDLAPPYHAARLHWDMPDGVAVDWVSGVIAASPDDVAAVMRSGSARVPSDRQYAGRMRHRRRTTRCRETGAGARQAGDIAHRRDPRALRSRPARRSPIPGTAPAPDHDAAGCNRV